MSESNFNESGDTSSPASSGLVFDEPDIISDTDRVKAWLSSDLLIHRLYLLRDLTEYARKIGPEDTRLLLLPSLPSWAEDEEHVIRQALAEQLNPLAELLDTFGPSGHDEVLLLILPLLPPLIEDEVTQVREHALEAFPRIASRLEIHEIESLLLPQISSLVHKEEEEARVSSSELIADLSHQCGRELTERLLLPLLLQLTKDEMFRVRKAAALAFQKVVPQVSQEVLETQLLPSFLDLSEDEIWGVRKACVESLVVINQHLPHSLKERNLLPFLLKAAQDPSRWVRSQAHQILGPVIATYSSSTVPSELLNLFLGMANLNKHSDQDSDYLYYAAYNFPAVALTLGASQWSLISDVFDSLSKDFQWKIRRCLSYSMHILASILDKDTDRLLLPSYNLFIKDLEEVRVGVVENMAEFIKYLPPERRLEFLPILTEIQHTPANWRFRRLIARQLGSLSSLFPPSVVESSLLPLALALLKDDVAAVRKAARPVIGPIAASLSSLPSSQLSFVKTLSQLAQEKSHFSRIAFCGLVPSCFGEIPPPLFEEFLLSPLLLLRSDGVPLVRIALAKTLMELKGKADFTPPPPFLECLTRLRSDPDRDVVLFSGGTPSVRPPPPDTPPPPLPPPPTLTPPSSPALPRSTPSTDTDS